MAYQQNKTEEDVKTTLYLYYVVIAELSYF